MPDTDEIPQTWGDRIRHLQRLGLDTQARAALLDIYGRSYGDPAEVRRVLGVSRSTLKRWRRNLKITDDDVRDEVATEVAHGGE